MTTTNRLVELKAARDAAWAAALEAEDAIAAAWDAFWAAEVSAWKAEDAAAAAWAAFDAADAAAWKAARAALDKE